MKFHIENAVPAEQVRIEKWLVYIAALLHIEHEDYCVHVRLGADSGDHRRAWMCPMPTLDRRLYIELTTTVPDEMLPALAHEMVHVKQVVRGEHMLDVKGNGCWKGRNYNARAVSNLAETDAAFYLSLPWEQEAHDKMWLLAATVKMLVG